VRSAATFTFQFLFHLNAKCIDVVNASVNSIVNDIAASNSNSAAFCKEEGFNYLPTSMPNLRMLLTTTSGGKASHLVAGSSTDDFLFPSIYSFS
jgi:hypothetical protein